MQPEVLVINTPESIDLELEPAGLGSRFLAIAIDTLIQLLLVGLLLLAGWLTGVVGLESIEALERTAESSWGIALLALLFWLLFYFYFLLLEVAWSGQTPGKRALGLRVLDRSGRPASAGALAIRNLVRMIDSLPVPIAYPAGVISFLCTRLGQRLGDLAAGTIVVRERRIRLPNPAKVPGGEYRPPGMIPPDPNVVAAHVQRLSPRDLDLVRLFLERRPALHWLARRSLSQRLAGALARKMAYPYALQYAEPFLETIYKVTSLAPES